MRRLLTIVAAGAASMIAAVVIFYAGALFLYGVGAYGDVNYDSDPVVYIVLGAVSAAFGCLFALLAVTLIRAAVRR